MKHVYLHAAVLIGLALGCVQAKAQSSYQLTNQNTSAVHTFTNDLGTAEMVGGMIVFEGQLQADLAVARAASANTGFLLASLQLLAQIKLFDDLPLSNEVGNVQGAVAALRDAPESSTGKYYVWGVTNGAPIAWVPLYQKDTPTQFPVADGATNYITFVFNYSDTTNSPVGPVTYQVFIGDTPTTQVASEPATSATVETNGINGVSLLGVGGLETVSSASGAPGPLSSEIGFSVYATANGMLLILDPVNEQGGAGKYFVVKAKINGVWVEVGRVASTGAGHYEFYAYPGLLAVGQSYEFRVIDESGYEHTLASLVEIKTIKMASVVMDASVMQVTFNSEPNKSYQVLVADSPSSSNWVPASVFYPVADGMAVGQEPFTAIGAQTTIKIQRGEYGNPATKGFFKIIKMTN